MNLKSLYIFGGLICLCSCGNTFFLDNFPKDKFFSYLPYEQGMSIHYFNGSDTLKLTVDLICHFYDRMEPDFGCYDCITESAYSIAKLENDTILLSISCSCTERTFFEMYLEEIHPYINPTSKDTILKETTLAQYRFEQKRTSDDIFNQFTEEIVLFGGAKVKQNIGLVSFMDKYGTEWTLIE